MSKLKKYQVEYIETISSIICVEAYNEDNAESLVRCGEVANIDDDRKQIYYGIAITNSKEVKNV